MPVTKEVRDDLGSDGSSEGLGFGSVKFRFWSRGQRLVRVALSETRKKRLMHLPGGGWVQLDQLG